MQEIGRRHPGAILAAELRKQKLTQATAAEMLGVTVQTINRVVRGKQAITPAMALLLSRCLGGEAFSWLEAQAHYDLGAALTSEMQDRLDRIQPASGRKREGRKSSSPRR